MVLRSFLNLSMLALPVCVFAPRVSSVETSTPESAKQVLKYIYSWHGRIWLIDIKLCQEVPTARGSENRFGCVEELKSGNVLAGETVMVWMHFFAPNNTKQQVILIYKRGLTPKGAVNLNIGGGTRYRAWRKFTPDKAGKWEIQVVFEPEEGDAIMLGRPPVPVQ